MKTKHKPATALPWRDAGDGLKAMIRGNDATIVALRHRLLAPVNAQNMSYIAHAANAYPQLVAALQAALCASKGDWQRGIAWDKAAATLLRSLGELE